jgi:hypothetical protein
MRSMIDLESLPTPACLAAIDTEPAPWLGGPFLCIWPKDCLPPAPSQPPRIAGIRPDPEVSGLAAGRLGRRQARPRIMAMRTLFPLLLLMALGLAISGCADPEQAQASRAAAEAATEGQDEAQCRANGVQPGSPAYDQCRARLVEARAHNDTVRAQRKEAFQPALGAGTDAQSGH